MSDATSLEEGIDKCHIDVSEVRLTSSDPTFSPKSRKAKAAARIQRQLLLVAERLRKKNYYLYPIGSIKTSDTKSPQIAPGTRWVDVASIITQGTTDHKNLNTHETRHIHALTTLSSGTLTSMLVKQKLYAVLSVYDSMPSLADLLEYDAKQKTFAETHAKFVCINLLMALRFLHEHKLFHGSICPKKIVFNDRGYPCLTGFGTADIIDDRQSRPRERTQLEYTSNEQLWWEHMTEVTDIFSLGCVIYAMIYGKPPHKGDDNQTTRRNIGNANFVAEFPPLTISLHGRKFISKCLRKKVSRRFSVLNVKNLFEDIPWFAGLNEDMLYKQNAVSPISAIIKKYEEEKQITNRSEIK